MKTLLKIIAIAIVLLGIETSTFAQGVTLTSSATATIVTTIAMVKNYNLDFGNLAVTTSPGDCILTPMAGANPTRTPSGGVTLPAFIGTPRAAEFYVTGVPGEYFTITIPTADITITNTTVPTETMIVRDLTTDQNLLSPGYWNEQLDALNGDAYFYVGGRVIVGASQVPGVYTNASAFTVTVNYQ